VGARGLEAHVKAFEKGTYLRVTADTIALAPPLIIQKTEIDQLFGTVREVLKTLS
jgi:beta-alanine--pyruvate transaminase